MPNILIRNVPEEDLAVIDRNARSQGLSREEYLRRQLSTLPRNTEPPTTLSALTDFAEQARDLLDEDVMRQAWS